MHQKVAVSDIPEQKARVVSGSYKNAASIIRTAGAASRRPFDLMHVSEWYGETD